MKNLWVYGVVFILWCSSHLVAIQTESIFESGNTSYSKGHYQAAIKDYQSLIQNNQKSGAIYYNLGNAYFKSGKQGMALLQYERAHQYLAHDEDLNANIQFLKEQLNLNKEMIESSWKERVRMYSRNKMTRQTWEIMSYGLYIICSVLESIFIFNMRLRKRDMVYISGVVLCFLISISFLRAAYFIEKNMKTGFVITPIITVRYSPSFSGAIAFKLTEGMKVEIIRDHNGWKHIRLNEKQSGWVNSDAISAI